MCSTANTANGSKMVRRRVRDAAGVSQVQQVRKPNVVDDYNNNMAGVDKSDQKIGTYNVLIKSIRYVVLHSWIIKTLFGHVLFNVF